MISKLRYLTQQGTVRGTHNILNKTTSDFGSLSTVCFYCDSVHGRKNAKGAESQTGHSVDNDTGITTLDKSFSNEMKEFTLKLLMNEIMSLRITYRENTQPRWRGRMTMQPGQVSHSKCFEIHSKNSLLQKRDFSTTLELLLNHKTPTRRTHTDTSMGWLAGLKHLMYGEQEPKAAFAEIDTPPDEASLSYLLWGCDTIQDVLNLVEPRIERKELDVSQYVEIMQKLQMIIYKDLGQKYAWLCEDIIPGIFIYLLLNDVKVSDFKYLEEAPAFLKLQKNLVELLDHMTVPQFAACMSGFVWLGLEATSPTLVEFVSKLPEFKDEEFTVLSLHILSVCLMSFERPDILVIRNIYPRLKALMKNNPEIPNDKKTLFSLIFLGHCRIPDVNVCIWLTEQILKIVEETDSLQDPFLASMTIKFCRDMRGIIDSQFNPRTYQIMAPVSESDESLGGLGLLSKLNQKLLDVVIINLMEIYNSLTCSDVARVAHSANRLRIANMPWAEYIHKRSLDLILTGNLSVGQLSQAITGLKDYTNMDESLAENIERVILDVIDVADVTSTAFILDYLSTHGTDNHELLRACQKKVIQHFDNMVSYRMLSKRMYQFLGKFPMENKEDHMVLQTKLMEVDNISFHDDTILKYLISQNNWLPTSPNLLNILAKQLSYCRLQDFFRLVEKAGNWVNFARHLALNGQLNKETLTAMSNFEINIGKRYFLAIESMDKLSDILYLTYKVGTFNPKILCMKTLMRIVEKHTDSTPMTEECFRILTKILDVKEGYISPKMFDRLLDAFTSMQQESLVIANNMLEVICKFFCSESDEITDLFKDKVNDILLTRIDMFTKVDNLLTRVRSMEYLCLLGVFPKDALTDLLNVDTLSKLDSFIDKIGDETFKRRAYQRILNINRCIVIDQPDMQIPWFMGNYVEECSLNTANPNPVRSRQLQRLMGEVLGTDYVGSQKLLEYGYTASYVCLLNKDKKLIPYSDNNFRFAQELGLQRLVIEFVFSDQQTTNGLIYLKLRRKHLSKLGYKLIEIHDWELQSIALSRRQDRTNYIKNKILGLPHSPSGSPTYKVPVDNESLPWNVAVETEGTSADDVSVMKMAL